VRRALLLGAAGLALAGAGGALGWSLHTAKLDARLYAQNRLIAVQVHLDAAPAEYVFLAGDSQAELQSPSERPCGREIVNGGVSGATAAVYADLLRSLRFPVRPRAAVLTIGTNDLLRKNDPLSADASARFEKAAGAIVATLKAAADEVVVTALPPVGRELDRWLEPAAVGRYSARLKALCERLGCRFADPFEALRDGDTGFAKPGAMRDGLHLSAYRPVMRALEPALCPTLPPSRPAAGP